MKLSLDIRFLTTAGATFIVAVAAVALVNAVAGTTAAAAGAAVLGVITTKLFDRLDYTPSFNLEFGAPKISAPWIYSAVAAVFIVHGCTVAAEIAGSAFQRMDPGGFPCRFWPLLTVAALDWGGFILAGWVVGRIFPERALTLSSIAAFVLVTAFLLKGLSPERVEAFLRCFLGPEAHPEDQESFRSGLATGAVVGVMFQGYLAIAMARLASRRLRAKAAV